MCIEKIHGTHSTNGRYIFLNRMSCIIVITSVCVFMRKFYIDVSYLTWFLIAFLLFNRFHFICFWYVWYIETHTEVCDIDIVTQFCFIFILCFFEICIINECISWWLLSKLRGGRRSHTHTCEYAGLLVISISRLCDGHANTSLAL